MLHGALICLGRPCSHTAAPPPLQAFLIRPPKAHGLPDQNRGLR